jgi:hypothetical protein
VGFVGGSGGAAEVLVAVEDSHSPVLTTVSEVQPATKNAAAVAITITVRIGSEVCPILIPAGQPGVTNSLSR